MLPESNLHSAKPKTDWPLSEQQVFDRALRYLPADCHLYHGLYLSKDDKSRRFEQDFVVTVPSLGILVIEAKGGPLESLDADPHEQSTNGAYLAKHQCEHYCKTVTRQQSTICTYDRGQRYPVELTFGVAGAAAVPDITREEIATSQSAQKAWLPPATTITRNDLDEIDGQPDDAQAEARLMRLLKKLFEQVPLKKRLSQPLTPAQTDELDKALLMNKQHFANPIEEQRRRAFQHRILQEVGSPNERSGSGRSTIKCGEREKLASYIYDLEKFDRGHSREILITCLNKNTAQKIRNMRHISEKPNVHICDFYTLCEELWNTTVFTDEEPSAFGARIFAKASRTEPNATYDEIMIADEWQAFSADWLRALLTAKRSGSPLIPSDQQLMVMRTLWDKTLPGHVLIKAVAGGGKTIVLSCFAKELAAEDPTQRVLLSCTNDILAETLREFLADCKGSVDVKTFDELCEPVLTRQDGEDDENYGERAYAALGGDETNVLPAEKRYDTILIDEGEDFYAATSWFKVVKKFSKDTLKCEDNPTGDGRIIIACDLNQSRRSGTSWAAQGINISSRSRVKRPLDRVRVMSKNFRNTRAITALAAKFNAVQSESEKAADSEEVRAAQPLRLDKDDARAVDGFLPILLCRTNVNTLRKEIVQQIDGMLRGTFNRNAIDEKLDPQQIAILYQSQQSDYTKKLLAKIETELKNSGIAYTALTSTNRSSKEELTSDTVKIMPISKAKGLEFKAVFLIGADHMSAKVRSADTQMFIAVTRANDYLVITDSLDGKTSDDGKDALTKVREAAAEGLVLKNTKGSSWSWLSGIFKETLMK